MKRQIIFTAILSCLMSFANAQWQQANGPFVGKIYCFAVSGSDIFAGTYGGGVWKRPLSEVTGIEATNNNQSNIAVYPNPANNNIIIDLQGLLSIQNNIISIYNIQGQRILEQSFNKEKIEVDMSGLSKGIYILKLITSDKIEITKLVKE